ncbi:hypothetical protein CsSME_00001835 [Camellia sinensis var. sinensis]
MSPQASMRIADCLPAEAIIQFIVGLDADYFGAEGDYATFIQTHIMPPLTGVRAGDAAGAPLAGEVV